MIKNAEKLALVCFFSAAVAKYLFFAGSLSDVAAFSSLGVLLFAYERYTSKQEHLRLEEKLEKLQKDQAISQKQVSEIVNYFNITKVTPQKFGQGGINGSKLL